MFRTAIGFHDAYVAAPSRKAALAAWGTDKDLFARGVAEEVTDPELTAEPLAAPGTVVRKMRSAPDEPAPTRRATKRRRAAAPADQPAAKPLPPLPPPPPRPSSQYRDQARRALEDARQRHEDEQRELARRERELANERRAIEQRQAKELRLLTRRLEQAEQDYQARLARWREQGGDESSPSG